MMTLNAFTDTETLIPIGFCTVTEPNSSATWNAVAGLFARYPDAVQVRLWDKGREVLEVDAEDYYAGATWTTCVTREVWL